MSHPPAFKLDTLAAGDADAQTQAHVGQCEACAAYVKRLEDDAAAFRAANDPATFARGVLERAARDRPVSRVLTMPRIVWVAVPVLAAAAAIALWLRTSQPSKTRDPTAAMSAALGTETTQETHFKGGLSVVAIRDRGGQQQRISGPFEVRPFDRVRIEVALERDGPIAAGLLSADGTWAPLLAPTELSAGTHFSELAARFDDSPTDALLLVGTPEEVARARQVRLFEHVVAWRIRSEPKE